MTIIRKLSAVAFVALLGSATLTACGGGSGFASGGSSSGGTAAAAGPLAVLIGSSGTSELDSVKAAVAASGVEATVEPASDLTQQLSQGFASGKPADVFYLSPDAIAGYAANGSLDPYFDQLPTKDSFVATLTSSFTVKGQVYCAPKDFSTLALVINTDMWAAAGLTDADIPTTWEQLQTVSQKLTNDKVVGLAFSPEYARVGAFMAQAGGSLLSEDGATATVDSPENLAGLNYVKGLLTSGDAKFSSQVGAGWGGEAFGKGLSAMTIEGNWIEGALKADFPNIKYKVVELPAGPKGKGTLQFSNCWGIAADSPNKANAMKLVEKLTEPAQQMTFADDFGVMPSTTQGLADYTAKYPEQAAFAKGAEYAQTVPNIAGSADVIKDFNAQIEQLATGDPAAILKSAQTNMAAAVADAK
ncbi:extracellular solute-binding protein [Micrococcales bacterium 31B]|nr:extracellular solute-binding protein [Micrococcales bacterium 31B]